MLGVMGEAGVFASGGGICWAITELVEMLSVGRMMGSKGYWGTSVCFSPCLHWVLCFQKSVVQMRMLKWWDFLGSFGRW